MGNNYEAGIIIVEEVRFSVKGGLYLFQGNRIKIGSGPGSALRK
jgi:hypothetical protein